MKLRRRLEVEEYDEVPRIQEWKVENELKGLKRGKAPRPDSIENNALKDFAKVLKKPLVKLFNLILEEEEETPEQWTSELILIHKKK